MATEQPTMLKNVGWVIGFWVSGIILVALTNTAWRVVQKLFTGNPILWDSLVGWSVTFGGTVGIIGGVWEIAHQPLKFTIIPALLGGVIATFCWTGAILADNGTPPGLGGYGIGAILGAIAVLIMKKFKKLPRIEDSN